MCAEALVQQHFFSAPERFLANWVEPIFEGRKNMPHAIVFKKLNKKFEIKFETSNIEVPDLEK